MSGEREEFEARLATLVARAAAERQDIGEQFAPVRRIDTGLAWLAQKKTELSALGLGAGLGLSALMLALPTGRFSVLRGGMALFQLAGSVKRLFTRRHAVEGARSSSGAPGS